MKATLRTLTALLVLGACQKSTVDPQAAPQDFAIDFERDFALHYRQQASLPAAGVPELVVRLAELQYTYCPEGMKCLVGPSAWPELAITDAQGRTQTLKLPDGPASTNPGWLDTTSVHANGRRYLLTYTLWEIDGAGTRPPTPGKSDYALWFHVAKKP